MAQRGRIFPVPFEGSAAGEFGPDGLGAPVLRTLSVTLDTARLKQEIEIGGNFLWVSDATDNVSNVSISFSRETADQGILFKNGTRISGLNFSRIFLTHAAQAGKTLTFTYATEQVQTGLEIDNPSGDFSSITLNGPTASTTDPDESLAVAAESTVPANAARTRLVVEADIDNTEDLRVGTTVADATGLRLTPGAQQEFFTTEAVVVRNISTNLAAQSFRWFEETT